MKYPKLTIFLLIVVAIVAWLVVSGIEPNRAPAPLAAASTQAKPGAVLVIGGTRATGLEVVRLLRARGDDVIVLARPDSAADEAEKLGARIVRGNALRPAELKEALAVTQCRAVVSTLGTRNPSEPPPDFEGNRNAVDAAKAAGVNRFVLVTVIGAGDSYAAAPALVKRVMKGALVAKTQAEDYLKASGLDYTIIRPGGLLTRKAQGKAYLTEDIRSMSWIGRADLAPLIVQALDDPHAIGKTYHAFDPAHTRFWTIFSN